MKKKIQDNPIELLKSIKILMHKPERSKYPCVSINEAFKRVIKMKQKDNGNIIDHSKRLKQDEHILESHARKNILGNSVEKI